MMRKVVFFTTGMTAGGAERVIATLANASEARGIEVVVAILKGETSAYRLAPGVRLRSARLSPGIRSMPASVRFYLRLIREESPDVVASFSTKSDIVALLSKILFHARGRLIVSDRADPYSRVRWMQLICNLLYRWSDALVCQSTSVADYYLKKCKPARIFVIPNPLNEESVGEPTASSRTETMISVGRLVEQKNHRLAILAFREIHQKFPWIALKIFGAGPLERELKQLVRSEGLDGRVTFAGIVPNVIRENADAALLLFTSSYEGYPNALLEAVATGIPAVATDFSPGTARELVEDGVNGYIVPVGNQDSLVEATIKVLSGALDPQTIREASQRVRERHRTDRVLSDWLNVFRSA